MAWFAAILTRAGVVSDYVEPRGLTITRRLNAPSECQFNLDYEAADRPDIEVGEHSVAVYKDGVVRFAGPVVARDRSGDGAGGRRMSVRAMDPFHVLQHRLLNWQAIDFFSGTNGDDLEADHTSETGHTWTYGYTNDDWTIQGNRVYCSSVDTTTGEAFARIENEDGPLPSAGELELILRCTWTVVGSPASAQYSGLAWCWDASTEDGYLLVIQENGNSFLQESIAGSRSSMTSNVGVSSASKTVEIHWSPSNNFHEVFIDGARIHVVQDATRSTGDFGLFHVGAQVGTSTNHIGIDDFHVTRTYTYTQVDAGDIAADLVDLANQAWPTGLGMGTVDTTVNRDRTYEEDKNVGEAITQLAEVEGGFEFRVDAFLSGSQMGKLEIRDSTGWTDQPDVHFAFGTGVYDNLAGYQISEELPRNAVTGIGREGAALAGEDLRILETVPESIALRGRWDWKVEHTDVTTRETIQDHARAAFEGDPYPVYSVKPAAPTELSDSTYAPQLWTDFDVGDTVRMTITEEDVNNLTMKVMSATVAVSDDGEVETLSALDLVKDE